MTPLKSLAPGTGVRHSEFNHSADKPAHFLQIWLLPSQTNIAPGYEQKHFDAQAKRGQLVLVGSPDGAAGSVTLHANASLRAGLFHGNERAELALDPSRLAYVHLVRGSLRVNGQYLQAGDALTLSQEQRLVLDEGQDSEVLVFDLQA